MSSSLASKVEQTKKLFNLKGVDPQKDDFLVGYDMNGPITRKDATEFTPHDGVPEAIRSLNRLENVETALISGWDLATLRHVRDEKIELEEMGIVGELGSVYELEGQLNQVTDNSYEDINKLTRELMVSAAEYDEKGVKLHFQGNVSPVVGCAYMEADGNEKDDRAMLYEHPLVEKASIDDLYRTLNKKGDFELGEEKESLTFSPELDNVNALRESFSDYPLVGWRVSYAKDGRLQIRRDTADRDEFEVEDVHAFLEDVTTGHGFVPDHNPDWCSDYEKQKTEISKQIGAEAYAEAVFESEDFVITNVGDKKGDGLEGYRRVTFGQEGMPITEDENNFVPIEDYNENDLLEPYVPVKNAAEYSNIMREILI